MKTFFIKRTYLINLIATFASQASTAISILLLTPVFLANLGEFKFSLYGVLLNLIVFASVFDFSLNTTLVRRLIGQAESASDSINTVFNFFLLILLIGIPMYYLSFVVGVVHVTDNRGLYSILIALIVAQNMIAVMFESVMQSVNQWKHAKFIRVVRTLAEAILLYWASKKGNLLYLFIVSGVVNLFYLVALAWKAKQLVPFTLKLGLPKLHLVFEQLKDSFWYFQNTIASVITFNFQIVMLSHLLDATQMTIYLLVFRFFEIFRLGLTNFAMLLFPSIAIEQNLGNWGTIFNIYKKSIGVIAIIVVLVILPILFFGYGVFQLWSGLDSDIALSIFVGYGFYVGLLVIDHVSGVFVSALKFNRNTAIVSSIQCVILLILTYLLVLKFGVLGAIYASLTSFLCTSLWYNPWYLWNRLKRLS